MKAPRERWVRLWCYGGRGHRRDYETFIRSSETNLKDEAERFGDSNFTPGESMFTYGFEFIRKPPQKWLLRRIEVVKGAIQGKQDYLAMLEKYAAKRSAR